MTQDDAEKAIAESLRWLQSLKTASMSYDMFASLIAQAPRHADVIARFARLFYDRNVKLAEENALLRNELHEQRSTRVDRTDERMRQRARDLVAIAEELSGLIEIGAPIDPAEDVDTNPGNQPLKPQDFVQGRSIMRDVKEGLHRLGERK
jgi:hypothetical protein